MKNHFRLISFWVFMGIMSLCYGQGTVANYQVIPLPQEISTVKGAPFVLNNDVKIVYPKGNELMKRNAQFLADYLKKTCGNDFAIKTSKAGKKDIELRLGLDSKNPEAYRLNVSGNGVVITGASEAGVFYGIQTLRKSVPVQGNNITLPAVEINDYPRFGYRGVHFDISRHFFTPDEAKTYIDMMVLHNMNRLHWHLTDDQGWRLEIKKHPKLTEVGSVRKETVIGRNSGKYDGKPYGGYYTQKQAREIVEYAAQRYITVIPEVDLPGHMQAALTAYPELGCTGGPYEVWTMWGISDDVLCAGNDKTLQFINDVFAEIIDIFPSEYIHIGGDECPKVRWESCPKCQARIEALGIKSDGKHTKEQFLQSYVMNQAADFLSKHGRKVIGWDEILEGGLAANATVMSWQGENGAIEAARQGHDAIMTPVTHMYFDYYQSTDVDNEPLAIGNYIPLEKVYHYEPVPASLTPEQQKHIIGVQANHWSEYLTSFSQLQYMAFPRWAALSDIQWTEKGRKDYQGFLSRLLRLVDNYKSEGYNYAKHAFDVKADYDASPAEGMLKVKLSTIGDAPIYYTLDGSAPFRTSVKYKDVIDIRKNSALKAVVVRPDGNSRILSEKINFCKSSLKPIIANQPVDKRYGYKGVSTLVDGLKGKNNYKTGRWIAFYENDMDVTIDLLESTQISSAAITTFVEMGDWIFDAKGFAVEISNDGKSFTRVASEEYPTMKQDDSNGLIDHKITFEPVETRYVRVVALSEKSIPEWHSGKNNPAYLFVDEITLD